MKLARLCPRNAHSNQQYLDKLLLVPHEESRNFSIMMEDHEGRRLEPHLKLTYKEALTQKCAAA